MRRVLHLLNNTRHPKRQQTKQNLEDKPRSTIFGHQTEIQGRKRSRCLVESACLNSTRNASYVQEFRKFDRRLDNWKRQDRAGDLKPRVIVFTVIG